MYLKVYKKQEELGGKNVDIFWKKGE